MLVILSLLLSLVLTYGSHIDKITKELDQLAVEPKVQSEHKPLQSILVEDSSLIREWPTAEIVDYLGQVSGLSICPKGYLYIFHRADREMKEKSFDDNNRYIGGEEGTIKDNTILRMNNKIRDPYIISEFGDNLFYLPHGIFVDKKYIWTTDVALHQVFRFPHGSNAPDLILGEKFIPGNDKFHFCKPTHAVSTSHGSLFVADGYCNSRIVMFDKAGKYIMQFGDQEGDAKLNLPHHLAMLESKDLICVADRENNRIQCYSAGIKKEVRPGQLLKVISDVRFGPVYAIGFNVKDNILYIVSGMTVENEKSRVFLYDWDNETITGAMDFPGPNGFGLAHAISVYPGEKYIAIGSLTKECPADIETCLERLESNKSYIPRNIWLYELRDKTVELK